MSNLRLRLPYGREISLVDVLRFCFDLNDTDLSVMLELLESGRMTVEELVGKLHVNRSSINKSLLKLLKIGLIEREVMRVEGRIGRPRYAYKAKSNEEIRDILSSRFKMCAEAAFKLIDEITGKET